MGKFYFKEVMHEKNAALSMAGAARDAAKTDSTKMR
jgi:hypothetical protein